VVVQRPHEPRKEGISQVKSSHSPKIASITFDDPNLTGHLGLGPVMELAHATRLPELIDQCISIPTDKGANPGIKTLTLIAGMATGADTINDIDVLRTGATSELIGPIRAASTVGHFLRQATHGHVSQFAQALRAWLPVLGQATRVLGSPTDTGVVFTDIDASSKRIYGSAKQGGAVGYRRFKALDMLLVTVSSSTFAPVVLEARLRGGSAHSAKGAASLLTQGLNQINNTFLGSRPLVVRADSAYYNQSMVRASTTHGAGVIITTPKTKRVTTAIEQIPAQHWQDVTYDTPVWDEHDHRMVQEAQVGEINFSAFGSRDKKTAIPGRLVVRRVKVLTKPPKGQGTLNMDLWRYHAVFTTVDEHVMSTAQIDSAARDHAIIEQVNADLKNSALAHMPSGSFTANHMWLLAAIAAFNLTRAAATLTHTPTLIKATTATIRHKLINIPARLAHTSRRLHAHATTNWLWARPFTTMATTIRALT
jgi:hypothetical protein